MATTETNASPVGEQLRELETRIAAQRAKAEAATAAREEAESKATEAAAMLSLGEATEALARNADQLLDTALRAEEGAIEGVAILERRLAAIRDSEPEIVRKQKERTNVGNSLRNHASQLFGRITDLADVFEDGHQANLQLAHIERELEALGDPSAGTIIAAVEPPPTLPLALWVALAPPEAKAAIATIQQREVLRERLNQIVQSADPRRALLAHELSSRLAEGERIVSALSAGVTVETTAPSVMPDAVMGESGTLTQPVAQPMGS
jgi:hypothetical protein